MRAVVVVLTVLPFAVVGIIAASLAAEDARATLRAEALGRARTVMAAVDGELRGHIRTIEALATSGSIEKGDVRAFYEETRRVLTSQPQWLNVGLQSASGAQLFNAVAPYGPVAAPQADQESLERTLERGTPQVGNMAVGVAIDTAATRIRVPVRSGGKVRYVISVPLRPQLFEDIVGRQSLPAEWSIALLDGKRRLIAGSELAGDTRHKDVEHKQHAIRSARSLGADMYSASTRSELSGWMVTVAMPDDVIEAAAWAAARPIVMGMLAAAAIGAVTLSLLRRLLTN